MSEPTPPDEIDADPTLQQLEIAQKQAILYARELRQLYNAEREKRRQLESAHRDLEEAHRRLAALDEVKTAFIDVLSHELRTPLAILRGYLELISDGVAGELNEEQIAFFSVALEKADQLTDIIEELTTFSRLSADAKIDVPGIASLADIIGEIERLFQPISRQRQIAFRIEMPDPLPDYTGDAGLVQLILRHLLRNAFEFNHAGGEVLLQISDSADAIHIRVKDTGEGIPEEKQREIFESFRQVESHLTRRHPGLGLGLNVVKRAVARLEGDITVQSTVGQGSTFIVTLPRRPISRSELLEQITGTMRNPQESP